MTDLTNTTGPTEAQLENRKDLAERMREVGEADREDLVPLDDV